jgi:preprotein translocase subunit YajC
VILTILLMAQQGGEQGGGGGFSLLLPFILIFVIMYLLMIRPQAKKQKQRQKMLEAIQKGDNIITTGGIHGKIVSFGDDGKTVIVKVDDNVKLNVDRSAIGIVKGIEKK